SIEINQGASADLNLIRYYPSLKFIQIASEEGFSSGVNASKGRILLKTNKNYSFLVTLTADNMMPKTIQYRFDHSQGIIMRD
ncbi:MAG: hypothetical protein ABUT20_43005, partial [Bacteroidota bacterium]